MSRVVIATSNKKVETYLGNVLSDHLDIGTAVLCPDVPSLINYLDETPSRVVLVDVEPDPDKALDDLEPLVNKFSSSRFIVLCGESDRGFEARAMQIGIRWVQPGDGSTKELSEIIRRLLPDDTEVEAGGKCIVVLQASGGCGATTIAINLANELGLASKKRILLVDFDFVFGTIGINLELTGRYTASDLLSHEGAIDSHLISSAAVHYSDSIDVLLSPASVDVAHGFKLEGGRIPAVLRACRQAYAYTVIDAPRLPMELTARISESCNQSVIVLQPSVKDIRVAKMMIMALMDLNVRRQGIKPVLNRTSKKRNSISLNEAQEALGSIPLGMLRNDYISAIRGINYGKPLAEAASRSHLRRDIVELSKGLAN